MDSSELELKVLNIIKEKVSQEKRHKLTIDSNLAQFGLDSLDSVELLMELEDQLNMGRIPDEAAETFITGRRIVEYVQNPLEYQAKYCNKTSTTPNA